LVIKGVLKVGGTCQVALESEDDGVSLINRYAGQRNGAGGVDNPAPHVLSRRHISHVENEALYRNVKPYPNNSSGRGGANWLDPVGVNAISNYALVRSPEVLRHPQVTQ